MSDGGIVIEGPCDTCHRIARSRFYDDGSIEHPHLCAVHAMKAKPCAGAGVLRATVAEPPWARDVPVPESALPIAVLRASWWRRLLARAHVRRFEVDQLWRLKLEAMQRINMELERKVVLALGMCAELREENRGLRIRCGAPPRLPIAGPGVSRRG
ncbi:MAG TPA: hypothetical protein VGG74_21160 [Kofleriaceae bacterium]